MPAVVETMFSVREVPWHGLGQVIQEAPNSDEALKIAGLDWDVIPSPVMVNNIVVPNLKANVRSSDNTVLGIVTDRYSIVQNREAFSFTDKLIEEGEVLYETAGSLRNGKQVWMLARMREQVNILGDDVTPYICFTNTHDGSGSVKVLMTPVRVVCQNTLNLAIQQAHRSWSTSHVGKMEKKLEEAQRTLGLAKDYMEGLNETAHQMTDIRITPATWEEMVNELLPSNEKMSPRALETLAIKRQNLHNAMMADDIAKFRGTGWAAINAVSDFITHAKPARETAKYNENLFGSVVHGHFFIDKAVDLLKKVA